MTTNHDAATELDSMANRITPPFPEDPTAPPNDYAVGLSDAAAMLRVRAGDPEQKRALGQLTKAGLLGTSRVRGRDEDEIFLTETGDRVLAEWSSQHGEPT